MDWSIQEIAQLTSTTSRTLRHYDAIGLLPPSRIAANGYRCYDEAALVRLQRILLLRELGLPLARIAEVLDDTEDPIAALSEHVSALGRERERLGRQMDGGGAMIAIDIAGGFEAARTFVEHCDLIVHAVSLGGADTLIQHPASLTHRPVAAAAKPGDGLVRLSVGLEHVDDLARDLFLALDSIRSAA